uniref:unspecific monooxygenase n=1 Tax=Glyphodes pyloalis TaxID=1242752 RepID=A0A5J6BTI8_GLYPY|nr:cytochrome CYP6AB51 [Glyphodes pyloalis]
MLPLILIVTILVVFYFYNVRNFNYWVKRGVKHDKPVIFFGTNSKNFLMRQSRSDAMEEMYWKYPDEKVVGYFRSTTPELILRDPEIIKQVLISDFSSFYMRGFHPNRHAIEPVIRNLFVVEGDLWKMLRQRMTPAFTSGKLKAMFPLIIERAEKLQEVLLNKDPGEPVDARDLMARYTTDFIGSIGFGLDTESLNEEDNDFRKLGFDIFNVGFKDFVVVVLKEMFPVLCKDLKMFGRIEKRSFDLVKKILQSRSYKPIGRNDFVDQLLHYRQLGTVEIESIERTLPDGTPERVVFEFDDIIITAQMIVFFAAGFETSSSTTSYTLHQLAFHPEIQKKVQQEIDEVLTKHNNKLSYDAVKEMSYLEWVFKESMRHFPALGHLMRVCTTKYKFSDIDLSIDPGVRVVVPVKALHMDPKYWDSPEEFCPERFHPDNLTIKQKSVYFPFGEGPRNCIGSRLGLMQSLAGLAAVLSRFSVEPASTTIRYPGTDPLSDIVQSPKGGKLPLIFRERERIVVS